MANNGSPKAQLEKLERLIIVFKDFQKDFKEEPPISEIGKAHWEQWRDTVNKKLAEMKAEKKYLKETAKLDRGDIQRIESKHRIWQKYEEKFFERLAMVDKADEMKAAALNTSKPADSSKSAPKPFIPFHSTPMLLPEEKADAQDLQKAISAIKQYNNMHRKQSPALPNQK